MTRFLSRIEFLVVAALVGSISAVLWLLILAALWNWMWTGHAVPPEGRR